MIIGYARVSTSEQNGNGQKAELDKVCDRVELEVASGGRWDRPMLQAVLRQLRPGDCLIVWKLDRLSRSLADLLSILKKIEEAGAAFRSLTEAIDTSTPVGKMLLGVLGSFAQFERDMLRERTLLGLARARAEGRIGGGRCALNTKQQAEAIRMVTEEGRSQTEVAVLFDVSASTICRLVSERRVLERT
jgi:DNA invertase Pin-like site-specific DNA recombinase